VSPADGGAEALGSEGSTSPPRTREGKQGQAHLSPTMAATGDEGLQHPGEGASGTWRWQKGASSTGALCLCSGQGCPASKRGAEARQAAPNDRARRFGSLSAPVLLSPSLQGERRQTGGIPEAVEATDVLQPFSRPSGAPTAKLLPSHPWLKSCNATEPQQARSQTGCSGLRVNKGGKSH